MYDAAGLAGFTNVIHEGENATSAQYTVITDTFGTVHEIRNRISNKLLASFSYDPWGKCTVDTHGSEATSVSATFPFRWKGYYYDIELSFTSITYRTSLTSLTQKNEKQQKIRKTGQYCIEYD